MAEGDASAELLGRIDRFGRLPRLPVNSDGKMRREEVRLAIVQSDAAVERRPFGFHAALLRAAEQIAVFPANARASQFFGAVTNAGLDAAMLTLGDGHAHRHFLVHEDWLFERFDVGKFEPLEPVELPLALAQVAPGESLAWPKRQLAANHLLADARISADINLAERRQDVRCRLEGQAPGPRAGV